VPKAVNSTPPAKGGKPYNTLRLEVSPCAIAALQQDGDITLQADRTIPDSSFTDQALKAVTPAIQQGLLWRMNDILTA
jgi:hypothetical protein